MVDGFRLSIFIQYLITTVIIGSIGTLLLKKQTHRLFLIIFTGGYWIYSGIGAAHKDVSGYYYLYYSIELLITTLFFVFFIFSLNTFCLRLSRKINIIWEKESKKQSNIFIIIYLLILFIPLIYPTNKLIRFFSPPSPNLTAVFAGSINGSNFTLVGKILQYAQLLLTPFFYLYLAKYTKKYRNVVFLQLLVLYLQYIKGGYIGRGTILMAFFILFIAYWEMNPKKRRKLFIIGIIFSIGLLFFFYYYMIARNGTTIQKATLLKAFTSIIDIELAFPKDVGIKIIESNNRANIFQYIKWIVTLPIPKIFIGSISGARINYEISEYILGLSRDSKGWYVVLPGFLGESIYIYGKLFFWIHGIFVAFLLALSVKIVERNRVFRFLKLYLVFLFGYNLNRAGISAILPDLVNGCMFLFLYLFLVNYNYKKYIKYFVS